MGNTTESGTEMGNKVKNIETVANALIKAMGWEVGKQIDAPEVLPDYESYFDERLQEDVTVSALRIDGFYIFPHTYEEEIETIANKKRKITVEGYMVHVETVEHNYPHAPDWADYAEVGTYPTAENAVAVVLIKLVEQRFDNALESISLAKYTGLMDDPEAHCTMME